VPRDTGQGLQLLGGLYGGAINFPADAGHLDPGNADFGGNGFIANSASIHPVLERGYLCHGDGCTAGVHLMQEQMYALTHGLPLRAVHHAYMAKKTAKPRHFLREWRKHRGLTLERAADGLGTTHATLSRIERGKISYTQPMLEALAELYRCAPADLIVRDPSSADSIWSIWDQIAPEQREQAVKVLETFKKTGTDGQ
jgi:transcriptional regulator with XRE-family HTH domain